MKVLVACKYPAGAVESNACKLIEKDFNPIYEWHGNLSKTSLSDVDFVIAIGGDGTVLSAAHYLIDKPILAVNSSPTTSEGALTTISIDQLDKKLKQIKTSVKNSRESLGSEKIINATDGSIYKEHIKNLNKNTLSV